MKNKRFLILLVIISMFMLVGCKVKSNTNNEEDIEISDEEPNRSGQTSTQSVDTQPKGKVSNSSESKQLQIG